MSRLSSYSKVSNRRGVWSSNTKATKHNSRGGWNSRGVGKKLIAGGEGVVGF